MDVGQYTVQSAQKRRCRLRTAVRTDVGQVRSENQDSYGYVRTSQGSLYVVADGMGGSGGGAVASAIAVNILTRAAVEHDGRITENSVRRAIEMTHQAIFEASRTDEALTKMGTTIVALAISGTEVVVAHVGDSRLYLWRGGQICQLTRDHTLVQELVDSGTISASDAEHHPMAHYLTRSLSPESTARAEVHTYPRPIEVGDRFLLCCDGLYNMVNEMDVCRILSEQSIEAAAKSLVDLANERGGTDNITVQVIEVAGLLEDGEDDGAPPPGESEVVVSTDYSASSLSDATKGIIQAVIEKARELNGATARSAPRPEDQIAMGGSAVDSLIFSGSNPTQDEIKRHEEEVRRVSSAAQEADAMASVLRETPKAERPHPTVDTYESDVVRSSRVREERDARWLWRTVAGLSVFVFAIVIGTAVVVLRRTPSVVSPSPESTVASSTSESGMAVREGAPIGEEAVSKTEVVISEAVPQSTVPSSALPEAAGTGGSKTLPEYQQGSETGVPAGSETKDESSPSRDDEQLFLPEGFAGSKPLLPGENGAGDEERLQIARLIADASSLEIPPPPSLLPGVEALPADEPIDWEKERLAKTAVGKLLPGGERGARDQLITSREELRTIVEEKAKLRDRIRDLDAKIGQLKLGSKSDAAKEIERLEAQGKEVEPAIELAQANFETAKRRYERWRERKEKAERRSGDEMSQLAEEIATSSVAVKRRKEAYEIAAFRYSNSLELFKDNSSDPDVAGQMAEHGRELRTRRANLEQAVLGAIETELRQTLFDLSEWGVILTDLRQKKDRIQRHIGFLKAFTAPPQNKTLLYEQQRKLLGERNELKAELEKLSERVSDELEMNFRREVVLESSGVNRR